MELHYSEACKDCIPKHIGPALHEIYESVGVSKWGCCDGPAEKFRFSYWFPWPDDDPYEGYDPRDDPNHPDFEKEIE